MTTFSDAIGNWHSLGNLHPVERQWLKFPVTATGSNSTFRAVFLCDNWAKMSSYCLFRSRYTLQGTDQTAAEIKRVYPAATPVIFQLPIAQELLDRSIYLRDIEIYKTRFRRSRVVGVSPDSIIEVQLQELWD